MISPLRCPWDFKSISALKDIIEPGSIVGTYLFFDGNIELGIASPERLVISHTNNYTVSEFWACARFDPLRLIKIIEHLNENITKDPRLFFTMQEAWAKYKDPFVRSAVFFLLNRCSTEGLISSGDVDFRRYSPISLNRFRPLKNLDHFHLMRTKSDNFLADIEGSATKAKSDYLLLPVGKFNYNLFDEGKPAGLEETKINHEGITSFFEQQKQKCMLIYKNHAKLFKIYNRHNLIMIDQHGNNTKNKQLCEEIIIANF